MHRIPSLLVCVMFSAPQQSCDLNWIIDTNPKSLHPLMSCQETTIVSYCFTFHWISRMFMHLNVYFSCHSCFTNPCNHFFLCFGCFEFLCGHLMSLCSHFAVALCPSLLCCVLFKSFIVCFRSVSLNLQWCLYVLVVSSFICLTFQ